MTKIKMLLVPMAILLGSQAGVAIADEIPKLDVSPTCRAEATPSPNRAAVDACMADEQKAREQLSREWGQFTTDVKASCTRETTGIAGIQSYVELLTCLQIGRDAKKLSTE
jgi:hypothetical protein